MYPDAQKIKQIVADAQKIVIIQADNPDADSLGTALALEHILADLGKDPYLYAAVDMPGYLRYLSGWDRVQNELPHQFDASIIVDASTMTLFERLANSGQQGWLASKPCVVIDHHEVVENPIPFATVTINDSGRASAGELLFMIAEELEWPVSAAAQALLMTSILGDTQGLTNQLASAETYRIMARFIDNGVDRPELEELRRAFGKMPQTIYRYKATLMERTEFAVDNQLALVGIPQSEINEFSPLYNPGPLIQGDMLQTDGVRIAIVIKYYDDGRVTGAIRCNPGAPIAAKIAEQLGGGGHPYASGFKVTDGRPYNEIKSECIKLTSDLLAKLDIGNTDETIQHAHA